MEFTITIPGLPVSWKAPQARIVRVGNKTYPQMYKPKPEKQWQDLVRNTVAAANIPYTEGPVRLWVVVVYPRPKGWPKKKRLERQPKTTKPDSVNILKAIEDPMEGVVFRNDAQVFDDRCVRMYGKPGEAPYTRIRIEMLDEISQLIEDESKRPAPPEQSEFDFDLGGSRDA